MFRLLFHVLCFLDRLLYGLYLVSYGFILISWSVLAQDRALNILSSVVMFCSHIDVFFGFDRLFVLSHLWYIIYIFNCLIIFYIFGVVFL